jgi:hypothetical protein
MLMVCKISYIFHLLVVYYLTAPCEGALTPEEQLPPMAETPQTWQAKHGRHGRHDRHATREGWLDYKVWPSY